MREPQLVESLSKKVAQIAVGSLHCLALTDDGEVGQLAIVGSIVDTN